MVYIGIIAALGITLYFYWHTQPELSRRQRIMLGILRFLTLSIVMILLFNPILSYKNRIEVKPRLLLLLDNSQSMQEQSGGTSKFELEKQAALELQLGLQQRNYEAELHYFAAGLEGDSNSSRLAQTFSDLQEKNLLQNVEAIDLFSDGWFDDDPDFMRNIQFPVNALDLDFKATGFDLEINRLRYNQRTWLKELTPFVVDVSAQGFTGNSRVKFFSNDKLLESKEVDFSQEKYQQLLFEFEFMDTGLKQFRFVIESDSLGELESANNMHPGAILVMPDKAKITLISDGMTWDGRYLVQAIIKNERFAADYLLKKTQLMKKNETVRLTDELTGTRVLCLINNGGLHFNNAEAALITAFVKQGGGLFLMGKSIKELAELNPAGPSNIARLFQGNFRLAPESSQYQSFNIMKEFLSEIPPVRFYYTTPRLGATRLATFQQEQEPPAIIFQEFEEGKVLFLSFLDLWKWQLWGEDDHYFTFMDNLMQWLSYDRAENFLAWSHQNSYLLGEDVQITLNAYDEKFAPVTDLKAEITLELDGKEYLQDFLTRSFDQYAYSFIAEKPGNYQVKIRDTERGLESKTSFIINQANSESRDRGINRALLSFLAEETGGKFYWNNDILAEYPAGEVRYEYLHKEIPLYKKWYTIALFLLVFCTEIFFRKRWGLL
ncbi:MAG: VWA domain-containing protein [Candidatus Cloacimonetes bacterium]|nr:VWA domain-containing protein [Candidatus Cloacimonadota bacterium]